MSLSAYKVSAVVAVSDMDRAESFYGGKLGLTAQGDDPDGGRTYRCDGETTLHIFPSPDNAGKSDATVAGWNVTNIEELVDELTGKGVTFERYDQPPLATDDKGIAAIGDSKGAWFKDPDGNTFGLIQRSEQRVDLAATLRRSYDMLNAGDLESFGALLADDFVEHEETPGLAPTKEGVLEFFRMYRAAFPDLRMEPQDVLVSGDIVTARARATGTHQGEMMGMPPTGRTIDVQLIDILRFDEDGIAHEHWGIFDVMTMMQQLGAIPDGSPA
jgi:steroid delta-isomerase-like uncharacterized protein